MPKAPANVDTSLSTFIPIARESMVLNVGGNCGFCSVEIIGRHLGISELHGFSRGKGGCTSTSMAQWLDRYNIEYMMATDRTNSVRLMKQFLAAKKPVLFSIPGHALVCCGITKAADGRELVWVVDNTGSEGAKIKGWTKEEFDRRHDGWVCGIVRCKLFPLRPRTPPGPAPHVDPTPDLIHPPDSGLAAKVKDLEDRTRALENGNAPALAKVAEDAAQRASSGLSDRIKALADKHPALEAAIERVKEKHPELAAKIDALAAKHPELHAKLQALESKLPELSAGLGLLSDKFGGISGLLSKAQTDLPKLGDAIDKLKTDGILTDAKAQKAHDILDRVIPHIGKIADLEAKVAPIIGAVPWGTILGALGTGAGVPAALMALLALLKKGSGGDTLAAVKGLADGIKEAIHAGKSVPQIVHLPTPVAATPPPTSA